MYFLSVCLSLHVIDIESFSAVSCKKGGGTWWTVSLRIWIVTRHSHTKIRDFFRHLFVFQKVVSHSNGENKHQGPDCDLPARDIVCLRTRLCCLHLNVQACKTRMRPGVDSAMVQAVSRRHHLNNPGPIQGRFIWDLRWTKRHWDRFFRTPRFFLVVIIRPMLHTHTLFISHLNCRYSDSLQAGRSGDRIPVGARFSALVQTGSGAQPASYTIGTGSFPGVTWRGVDHPPPFSAEVERRVELLPLCAFVACFRVNFTFIFTT